MQTAFQFNLDLHGVVNLEEEVAGILEAPIDEGHAELSAALPIISRKLGLNRSSQLVFAAMQNKNSMHLNRKASLRHYFPVYVLRSKDDFLVLSAFENIFVHFPVARIVAAITACRVYGDLTAGFAGRTVKLQCPTLECKRPMNSMERRAQRPVHLALIGIEHKYSLTGRRLRSGMPRQCG